MSFFCADQLPVCPSCCGSECRDPAGPEDEDQAVSQQYHPHLPHLFLPIPRLPVSSHPAGAGLQLYHRYSFFFYKVIQAIFNENCFLIPHVLYSFFLGIFNYYHLSLLLTSLNCVADPALYCFVSESARHGLYRAIFRPVARMLCCCRRRGNASPTNPATDSHEVATDENNGHPTVTLLTHNSVKTDSISKNAISITQTDEKNIISLTVQNNRHSDKCADNDGKSICMIGIEDMSLKTEKTDETEDQELK